LDFSISISCGLFAILFPFHREKELRMHTGRFVFSQLMDFIPKYEYDKCVRRYRGNRRVRSFSCYDQFLCMTFAQLTYRESLRDIVTCLDVLKPKLFHVGIRGEVSRSTLADANEKRHWRIYADFAQVLIAQARELYGEDDIGIDLKNTVYALDATTIDLCLSLFPWAHFQKTKSAVKLHTLLNLRGNIPEFIHISDGKMHDAKVLDHMLFETGAIYVMDRGYIDFRRLYAMHQSRAFFVTRARNNFQYARRYSRTVDKTTGLRADQTVVTTGADSKTTYPETLRRIVYRDAETRKKFVFITNNFALPALTIAQLYKARWRVELFFKWIKQHLRIKAFYGYSENAVKSQIWIAVCAYVLVAIAKKQLQLEHSLYTILQILSISLFEKTPILLVFSLDSMTAETEAHRNQLQLFDF
jgi:transposase